MAHIDSPVPTPDLDRLARRVRRMAGRLGGIVEELESIDLELANLRKATSETAGQHRPGDGPDRAALKAAKSGRRMETALKRAFETGISAIEIKRRPDGLAVAVIDGKRLDLPRRLGDVLGVLLAEASASERFIPFPELTALIEQKSGRPLTRRSTATLVWRLRIAFLEAGLSSFLIEAPPNRRGIRLLLRRPPSRTQENGHG